MYLWRSLIEMAIIMCLGISQCNIPVRYWAPCHIPPLSSMNGRRGSSCNDKSSSNPSGTSFPTSQWCYFSSFRQYMEACQTYNHAYYRNLCRIFCHPQRFLFLSCTDSKNWTSLCQDWYFLPNPTHQVSLNSRNCKNTRFYHVTPRTDRRAFPNPSIALQDVRPRWHYPEFASTCHASMKKTAVCYLKFHS